MKREPLSDDTKKRAEDAGLGKLVDHYEDGKPLTAAEFQDLWITTKIGKARISDKGRLEISRARPKVGAEWVEAFCGFRVNDSIFAPCRDDCPLLQIGGSDVYLNCGGTVVSYSLAKE